MRQQPTLWCPHQDCTREATEEVWPLVFELIKSGAKLKTCVPHHDLYSPPVDQQ